MIGGLVYGYLGFMILPIYASLERMDPALIEAGKDLYGTPRQTFWHVTWPQTLPGVLAGTVLVFLPAVGDFVSAQLLGGPDTYMVGNLIQQQFYGADNWPFGAALTIVLMAFLMIFMVFYLRGSAARREGSHERRRRARRRGARRSTRRGRPRASTGRAPCGPSPALVYAVPVRADRSSWSCSRSTARVAAGARRASRCAGTRSSGTTSRCATSLFASIEIAAITTVVATVLGTGLALGMMRSRVAHERAWPRCCC